MLMTIDNTKYVEDSLSYDFSLFEERPKKNNIIPLPSPKKQSAILIKLKSLSLASLILFIVLGIAGTVYLRAEINKTEVEIKKMDSKIAEVDSKKISLETKIDTLLSYKNLASVADELGMKKPSADQIKYIRTITEDKTCLN